MNAPSVILNTTSGLLRFATSGSVDDGKSTLIGRLLVDTKGIYEDQLQAAQNYHERKGGKGVDLALLTDGLQAERDQGITIDVAYRYFSTPRRKFIIADTPGHEQYTRNMVTGASTADLAIILIDARKGILPQSRRHACISHLLEIPHILVAINKMDLVDYSEAVYNQIVADFKVFAAKLGLHDVHYIPISALNGDMVVTRDNNMPWYQGNTLLGTLENVSIARDLTAHPFRFPVQVVNRPQGEELHDFRGYMGRIESGVIAVGDAITVQPSGMTSKIKAIYTGQGEADFAFAPQSVTLTLTDERDISRGDMLVKTGDTPQVEKQFQAKICWLDNSPLDFSKKYWIKHTTQTVRGVIHQLHYSLDIHSLEQKEIVGNTLQMNEIGLVSLKLLKPLIIDAYSHNRGTGSFIVIDSDTNNTVAAGMIV
ncbi:sulfate adenylyltransferase subunit CysN [Beggiatoa leptomitoformis]|uniref:sulfate adenylyltransferase n=1 Tax=Beggiatoa leptomitoformis TaxID=288004 RepID=A0A2N9YDK0_9GAMM|nr:sulfate adenylyltransferase subunit CysN [Beggiatoa leptomitoformis]ALG69029.1 sulfate adenylyltransferase subunit CysN [Beggiatoa leptomitoformis]AUI68567.1 sulfate adenylyltransferase subunit CysN [Beggiatoa leptomitoformis]